MSSSDKTSANLRKLFDYCIAQSFPIALYRLPESDKIELVIQTGSKTKHKLNTQEPGFVLAPFQTNKRCPIIFIKGDIISDELHLPAFNFTSPNRIKQNPNYPTNTANTTKQEFEKMVCVLRDKIRAGKFDKVVAARSVSTKAPATFHPVAFFKKLTKKYRQAFVSLVYTPTTGIWIGASPEILLSVKKNSYQTYSLAGTQINKHAQKIIWGEKEMAEQQIVSDYILKCFQSITPRKPIITGPETTKAGNLLHRRTVFNFKSIPYGKWGEVVQKLHPTPAVAGVPKRKSVQLIQQIEKNPRAYYSGYLGPVNLKNEAHLFVHLRCMHYSGNQLTFYGGCGITKDSIPSKEWKETSAKIATLKSVLHQ